MTGNIPARKRGFGYDPTTRSLGVYVDGALAASFPPTPGRTYFVNNITGASSNDGLSWANAMDEVSTAITASVAYQATQTSGNLVRNSIIIQGTSTKYTPITTMPLYTNMIGLGSNPRGQAFGNTRMGTTDDSADGASGDEAGNYWYNIQFSAGGSFDAVMLGVSFSSTWDNCTFGCASDNLACDAGFRITGSGSGSTFVDCASLVHNGTPVLGFTTEGTNFNDCLIMGCNFRGSTAAYLNSAYLAGNTIVRDGTFRGGSYGIDDNSTNDGIVGAMLFVNNFCYGTASASAGEAGLQLTHDDTARCIGNYCINQTTASVEY